MFCFLSVPIILWATLVRGPYVPPHVSDYAACGLDISESLLTLGEVGAEISEATDECVPSHGGSGPCAANVLSIIGAFTEVAAFLTDVGSVCAPLANEKVECAAHAQEIAAAVTMLASDSVAISNTCSKVNAGEEAPVVGDRRLGETAHAEHHVGWEAHEVNRGRDIAFCVFDSLKATALLVEAAHDIKSSVLICDSEAEARNKHKRAECSADINRVVGAFVSVAKFISQAAAVCSSTLELQPLCAADVTGLVAQLANVAAAGSAAASSCAAESEHGGAEDSEHAEVSEDEGHSNNTFPEPDDVSPHGALLQQAVYGPNRRLMQQTTFV